MNITKSCYWKKISEQISYDFNGLSQNEKFTQHLVKLATTINNIKICDTFRGKKIPAKISETNIQIVGDILKPSATQFNNSESIGNLRRIFVSMLILYLC